MRSIVSRIWYGYKEYIILVVLLLFSLMLISFSQKPAIRKVKTVSFGAFAFLTSGVSAVLEPFQTGFEVQRLREANARLMLQVNRLRENSFQNEELRGMLGFKDTSNLPLISASIVSKFVSTSQGNFIINIGEKEGIRSGMPVINHQGLIGTVYTVGPDFSIVRTLRNTELKVAVRNQRSRFDGVLEWNGSELIIKNIPKTFDMEVGDRIVTSDFSTKFPPSIPVGIVTGGNRNKAGMFNDISVKSFVDFVKIDNAFVVTIIPSKQINQLELNLVRDK